MDSGWLAGGILLLWLDCRWETEYAAEGAEWGRNGTGCADAERAQPRTTARPSRPQGGRESAAALWKKLDTIAENPGISRLSTLYKALSQAKSQRIFTNFSMGAPVILFAAALDTRTNVRI